MTIREDVVEDANTDASLTQGDAADAFLKKWMPDGDKDPSAPSQGAKSKEKEETPSPKDDEQEELIEDDSAGDDTDQEDDPEAEKQETIAGDDAKVKITVDGKEVTASVKDLKRLYGQEAALTRKSQETAAIRKQAEEHNTRHLTALQTLQKRAEERYKPFAEADMLVLSKELSPEDFKAVREEAKKAYEDYKYLTEELGNVTKEQGAKVHKEYQEKAAECLKVLTDPEKGIKGFDEALYGDLAKFAASQGLSEDTFHRITDPAFFRMVHAAMRYDRAKKVTAQKTAQPAKKVIRARQPTDASGRFAKADSGKAMQKLRESGSQDDAAEALLSRWGVDK
jgi:hypothetical protein